MSTTAIASTIRREPELLDRIIVVIGVRTGIGLETARRARADGAADKGKVHIEEGAQAA